MLPISVESLGFPFADRLLAIWRHRSYLRDGHTEAGFIHVVCSRKADGPFSPARFPDPSLPTITLRRPRSPFSSCSTSLLFAISAQPWSPRVSYGLVDTGADATLVPASLAVQLGHDLKDHGVRARVTKGIESTDITVYRHTFEIELLSATGGAVARSFRKVLVDCSESDVPVLLGASDFLTHFTWSVDYASRDVKLEW